MTLVDRDERTVAGVYFVEPSWKLFENDDDNGDDDDDCLLYTSPSPRD